VAVSEAHVGVDHVLAVSELQRLGQMQIEKTPLVQQIMLILVLVYLQLVSSLLAEQRNLHGLH
jgi:hypothetical protein